LEDTDRIRLAQDKDQWRVFDMTSNQQEMMGWDRYKNIIRWCPGNFATGLRKPWKIKARIGVSEPRFKPGNP
jgi:hypothetical protein